MTEIRTALTEVREAVDVPAPDRVAFRARVRAARRRRTTGRVLVGAAGLATVAAVVVGVVHVLPENEAPPIASAPPVAVADPTRVVGFVVRDRLVIGGPSGFTATDVPARNVLGILDGQLLQADYRGYLVAVPVGPDGGPGEARQLASIERAYLDRSGGRVVVATTAGGYRAWSPAAGWTELASVTGGLMAVDGDVRVESGPDGLVLVGPSGTVRTLPVVVNGSDLVSGLLAVETGRGARFYDTATGEVLARVRTEGTGALAPDGSTYARGSATGVVLVDPRTGRRTPVATEGDASVDQVAWTGPDTFVLTGRDDGTGTLQECDAVARTCRLLYEDPSGTLKLTS